jgi:predicted porin
MISKKAPKALLVSALALLFAPVLSAKGFSYSYGDVGYQRVNGDHYDVDEAVVNASFGVHDMVALQAGYIRGWTDGYPKTEDPSGNPDLNEFQFGLRPHYSFTKSLDAYIDLIYFNSKFNGDRSNTDIGGIYGAGIRYQAFKRVEFRLAGEYQSGDIDEGFLVIGPVIKLTKDFDLSIRTAHSSDSSNYFAGIRLNF